MFSPKMMTDIERSRACAIEKAKRDAHALLYGGTPEDVHSKAYAAAMKRPGDCPDLRTFATWADGEAQRAVSEHARKTKTSTAEGAK